MTLFFFVVFIYKQKSMSKLFLISEEEKNRIINLHESATKNLYLSEQVVTNHDSKYDYKKEGNNYYYKVKGSNNWVLSKGDAMSSIKTKVFKDNTELPITPVKNKKLKNNAFGDDVKIMTGFNPDFKNKINFDNLKVNDTTKNFCKPNDTECAQFVNDISDDTDVVGNAWEAYGLDTKLGSTIYSSFNGIDGNNVKNIIKYWQEINKRPQTKKWSLKGPLSNKISMMVDSLVPKKYNGPKLNPGDFVGIYYPGSKNHERAFYEGGKRWFVDGKPGNTIKKGDGWGMNTHIGRVGVVKNGVPLIFHNVDGTTKSDPPQNLRIAWVKRKNG